MVLAGQFDSMVDFKNSYHRRVQVRHPARLSRMRSTIWSPASVATDMLTHAPARAQRVIARRFSLARRIRGIGDRQFDSDDFAEESHTGNYLRPRHRPLGAVCRGGRGTGPELHRADQAVRR